MLLVRNLARVATRSVSSLSNQLSKTSQHIEDDIKNCFPVPVFKRALLHKSVALQDQNGSYSYNELVAASSKLASQLSNLCGKLMRTNYVLISLSTFFELQAEEVIHG